jgi:hypothetical protein
VLNRVAGIAAVATGCPAANCDAARATGGATASRVGARASVFHIQQHAGAVGAAQQLRGSRHDDQVDSTAQMLDWFKQAGAEPQHWMWQLYKTAAARTAAAQSEARAAIGDSEETGPPLLVTDLEVLDRLRYFAPLAERGRDPRHCARIPGEGQTRFALSHALT